MITTGNAKGHDELGREVLWSSQGQQVMMQWEQQYMRKCVDALRIHSHSDRVLEIGFGLAYSASHIQNFHPKRHTIIECDAAVLIDAERFAGEHSSVEILRGTWQSILPTLTGDTHQFDCVFFDDYPLPELETQGITQNQTRTLTTRSRWHDFLDAVLPHIAVGGRITGYLARDIDLQRQGCRVEITLVQVAASENCEYYSHKTALVPVITVVDASAACAMDAPTGNASHVPIQTSARLLRRVILSSSLNASVSPSLLVKSQLTSSSRRRFVDIQACLQEQELFDDDMVESDYHTNLDGIQQRDGDKAVDDAYGADDRKRFLAALRQKKMTSKK